MHRLDVGTKRPYITDDTKHSPIRMRKIESKSVCIHNNWFAVLLAIELHLGRINPLAASQYPAHQPMRYKVCQTIMGKAKANKPCSLLFSKPGHHALM